MATKYYSARLQTLDAEKKATRRYRNILANSGEIMESGEVRELADLYVMSVDGELIRVSDLDADPDKQTEHYSVKAQADHGSLIDGELVPSIEKQFGSCKVWINADGALMARMFFADDDDLANHAWAISEDASYSTGIDWFPEGYFGAGHAIDHPIGILREVSMVLTGNDPRAVTIDHKQANDAVGERKTQGDGECVEQQQSTKGEQEMSKDTLTREEADSIIAEVSAAVASYVDNTAENNDAEEAPAETAEATPAEATVQAPSQDAKTLRMPTVVIRDAAPRQEVKMEAEKDWLTSKEGHRAFADTLKAHGGLNGSFEQAWRAEVAKHQSLDDIAGIPSPAPVEQYWIDALQKSDGIISHFANANTKSIRLNAPVAVTEDTSDRAAGHAKGEDKQEQALTDLYRDVLTKMIYKKLSLDALEIYENPELIDFRAKELVDAIIVEYERSAIIGDGRSAGTPDLRTFDGTRGFFSVKADAAAAAGTVGNVFATTVQTSAGANLYDMVVAAKGQVRTEGAQIVIAKSSLVTSLLQATSSAGGYLIAPGSSIEGVLGVSRVYTPAWMDTDDTNDAYLLVDGAYLLIGQDTITNRTFFDVTTNSDVLLNEAPRGGSLRAYRGAVAIASAA